MPWNPVLRNMMVMATYTHSDCLIPDFNIEPFASIFWQCCVYSFDYSMHCAVFFASVCPKQRTVRRVHLSSSFSHGYLDFVTFLDATSVVVFFVFWIHIVVFLIRLIPIIIGLIFNSYLPPAASSAIGKAMKSFNSFRVFLHWGR